MAPMRATVQEATLFGAGLVFPSHFQSTYLTEESKWRRALKLRPGLLDTLSDGKFWVMTVAL